MQVPRSVVPAAVARQLRPGKLPKPAVLPESTPTEQVLLVSAPRRPVPRLALRSTPQGLLAPGLQDFGMQVAALAEPLSLLQAVAPVPDSLEQVR